MPPVRDGFDIGMDRVAETLTPMLRSYASIRGWPVSVIAALSVVNESGILTATVPPHLRAQMEALEFGTDRSAPKPAVGNFFYGSGTEKFLEQESADLSGVTDELDRLFR